MRQDPEATGIPRLEGQPIPSLRVMGSQGLLSLYCPLVRLRDHRLSRIEGLGQAMNQGEKKIRRTLHFKFALPTATEQMIAMMKSATPLYQMFGDAQIRFLQNVDDPTRFLQEIEYDAPESLETNRQQIAADPRVQAYLQAWRAMFPGAVELDVYKVL